MIGACFVHFCRRNRIELRCEGDQRTVQSDATIVDIHIPKKQEVPRGFAFVCFKHVKDANYLLDLNLKILIWGRKISMARARKSWIVGPSQVWANNRNLIGGARNGAHKHIRAKG